MPEFVDLHVIMSARLYGDVLMRAIQQNESMSELVERAVSGYLQEDNSDSISNKTPKGKHATGRREGWQQYRQTR